MKSLALTTRSLVLIAGTALTLAACEEAGPFDPTGTLSADHRGAISEREEIGEDDMSPSEAKHDDGRLTVMIQNLFVGTDIESVLAAPDPAQIPLRVAEAFGRIQATNFPERAVTIAAEIADVRPHLVGLQEVSLFRIQSPGDQIDPLTGAPNPTATPATGVTLDYLQILLDALAAKGVEYKAVSTITNIDLEVPMVDPQSPTFLSDIRLTDFDVVLAREDVDVSNPEAANYTVNLEVPLAGQTIVFRRGYSSIDATIDGSTFRFVNTHLEPTDPLPGAFIPDFQIAQITELLGTTLSDVSIPSILVGDFSTGDGGGRSPASQLTLDAGFFDLWEINPEREDGGATCCQAPDLLNFPSALDRRVDIIYYRDEETAANDRFSGSVLAEVVGNEAEDRTPSGLWPSDHGGVVATLRRTPGAAPSP